MAINDFNIGFVGKLDEKKTRSQLTRDIATVEKTLNDLKLQAKLDPGQIKNLENQLDNLKVELNNISISPQVLNNLAGEINTALDGIEISKISLSSGTAAQAQKNGEQIGKQIQSGINSVLQKGDFGKDFKSINIINSTKDTPATKKSLPHNETGKKIVDFISELIVNIPNARKQTNARAVERKTSPWGLAKSAFQLTKDALQDIYELDNALMNLQSTTSMTSGQLKALYFASNDIAKQMGVTTSQVIKQASAWGSLGYTSGDSAAKMAKLSSQFAAISPGMDIDESINGLAGIMKVYDIDEDHVLDGIISKINVIGNTADTSNKEIVNMLSKSSSAMKEASNSLEETIALETAAVEITKDDNAVGSAFKNLSMKLRGYDEETESYTNDFEELSGAIANLTRTSRTPGGISLFTDESKTEFKSTYQLLKEISEIYDQLDDKTQAQLLETVAGKQQGQIVAATLENFDVAEKAIKDMSNSAGSANSELSSVIDSLDYKLNRLNETSVGIVQNLFQRDDIKTVVDGFTQIGNAIDFATDKLGLFGTAGLIGEGILSAKGLGLI